jgi:pimeloyl-ACP methyl ester carboxylesterase
MPYADTTDARLHYETAGQGPPVILVMGLGVTATGWWRTVPVLADGLRVIAFDNRGVGRSDRPRGPYTTAQMADDVIAVLGPLRTLRVIRSRPSPPRPSWFTAARIA